MKPEEFVEMAAGLLTSREMEVAGSTNDAESTLDSMIGVARNIAAQTFASNALRATTLFDALGERILSLPKDALVLVRHEGQEVSIANVEVRENAVVLDLSEAEKGG